MKTRLADALAALDYLKSQLSEYTDDVTLDLVESYAVHVSNMVAGTPCHERCVICDTSRE